MGSPELDEEEVVVVGEQLVVLKEKGQPVEVQVPSTGAAGPVEVVPDSEFS